MYQETFGTAAFLRNVGGRGGFRRWLGQPLFNGAHEMTNQNQSGQDNQQQKHQNQPQSGQQSGQQQRQPGQQGQPGQPVKPGQHDTDQQGNKQR